MVVKLISVSEGFKQYELALQSKNYDQIKIWHKNFDLLLEHLIKNAYTNFGLDYNNILIYVVKFLEHNEGSKYIHFEYIKNKILKMWLELECIDTLTKFMV